jgi:hypothetical protein
MRISGIPSGIVVLAAMMLAIGRLYIPPIPQDARR